jgi:hypothetical protein
MNIRENPEYKTLRLFTTYLDSWMGGNFGDIDVWFNPARVLRWHKASVNNYSAQYKEDLKRY